MEEVQKKSFEVRTEREIVKEKEKEEFSQEKDIESSSKQPLTTLGTFEKKRNSISLSSWCYYKHLTFFFCNFTVFRKREGD
jgi:hypothetical protein